VQLQFFFILLYVSLLCVNEYEEKETEDKTVWNSNSQL